MKERRDSACAPSPAGAGMISEKIGDLFLMRFPGLFAADGLRHAVFTRKGGESQGPHASLNVATGTGDESDRVRRNREKIIRAMGGGAPVFLRQDHGTRVASVDDAFPAGADSEAADAAITDRPDRLLFIQVADCQAVIVYDPVGRAVANIHSGWRGSIADIVGKTVAMMQTAFGSRPEDLMAGIGPSLGPCCAEFIHYRTEIPRGLWRYRTGRHHFDFWAMSVDQLRATGVAERNIEVAGLCTRCRTDLFYSYRGEKTTGRFAVVAGLAGEGEKGR